MDDRDRTEEVRLEEIRRRARETREQEKREKSEPRSRRTDRGPHVSAWRSPAGGTMPASYPMEDRWRPNERAVRETWSPPARVYERDGALIVCLDLPGLERKDVEVRVEDQMLVVEGERLDDRPQDGGVDARSRWGYGPFRREVALPHPVDADHVKARFQNGRLEVAVPQPRREERRTRIKLET